MEYQPDTVVAIVGFCLLLFGYSPQLRLLPALCAFIMPLYPEQAAFTAYAVVLIFGTVYEMVGVGLSVAGLSREV